MTAAIMALYFRLCISISRASHKRKSTYNMCQQIISYFGKLTKPRGSRDVRGDITIAATESKCMEDHVRSHILRGVTDKQSRSQ
ncbi:hypothetical protein FPQ18DRAFT_336300 [Pyronema domesticum]|nr:hypothetical protein FPQ18DRAFT_336300 [Pyronema domesticum]